MKKYFLNAFLFIIIAGQAIVIVYAIFVTLNYFVNLKP